MVRYYLLLLLFFASCCFAQDGISPDTLYTFSAASYNYLIEWDGPWCADTTSQPQDDCSFYGNCTVAGDTCKHLSGKTRSTLDIQAQATYVDFMGNIAFDFSRTFALFDTKTMPGMSSMEKVDSVSVMFNLLGSSSPADGDSLFVVKFEPGRQDSPWVKDYSHADTFNLCNFYRCGSSGLIWRTDETSYWGEHGEDLGVGWNTISIDTSFLNIGDTTGIGFVTRLRCDTTGGDEPTGTNIYIFCCGDGMCSDSNLFRIIYYYSRRYNDISHQDNADGISPDTIQFICSVALEEISTPGFWTGIGYYWNREPGPGAPGSGGDAFFGSDSSYCWGCDTSACGTWNYAMQPETEATLIGGGYDYYKMRRAYFLMELEESIPDTTEIDSMRFYLRVADVQVDEGDSLFIVTYTPRDTNGEGCPIRYAGHWNEVLQRFTYPVVSGPSCWCNFYQCGDYKIWGDIPDRSYGRVPQYLGWTWFPIHPDIIDFGTASVGDTFGVGLILRDEHNPAPTDTNKVHILVGADCPYIIYWFSEPEAEAGFINWGLAPPHLNWGLPLNQPRRAWGGSRRP